MKSFFKKTSSSLKITFLILVIAVTVPLNFVYVMDSFQRLSISTATVNSFGYIRGSIQRATKSDNTISKEIIIKEVDDKLDFVTNSYVDKIEFNGKEEDALIEQLSLAYVCWYDFKNILHADNQKALFTQSEKCWDITNNLTNYVEKIEEDNQKIFRQNLKIRMIFTLIVSFMLFSIVWFSVRGVLEQSVITDALTKLHNRYYFMKQIEHYLSIALRYKENLTLVFIDIDFFKNVNDTFGHQVGDSVLQEVSAIIQENLRESDSAYRYGGEEFVIIATHTSAKEALVLANRFRKTIENHNFDRVKKVTISLGISELKEDDHSLSLIKRADDALYLAKNGGRNQVKTVL